MTDPFRIIATALTTVSSRELIPFLKDYFKKESVDQIIIGLPLNWDESATHATPLVEKCVLELKKNFPGIPIEKVDERFTSKMAKNSMLEMGMKKKDRRKKELVDQIAATIILQEYLNRQQA